MTVTEDNNADQSASQDGYATVFKEATAPCLFCGSESSKALFTFKDPGGRAYRLRRCLDCQARFIDPTPSPDDLARAYDAAYYGQGAGKFSGPVEAILDRFRRDRAVRLPNSCQTGRGCWMSAAGTAASCGLCMRWALSNSTGSNCRALRRTGPHATRSSG